LLQCLFAVDAADLCFHCRRHTPWGGHKHQTLLVYLSRFWNALDWLNNILFLSAIFLRIQLLYLVVDRAPVVPTNQFNYAIEEAASLSSQQLFINSFNIFLSTLKIFKYFEFQDRLNVLTRTIATAWTDLYHFLVMFIVIFVGFGIIGYLLFGTALQSYSTIGNCLQATFELVIGNYDLQSIMRIDLGLSLLYFYVFVFLVSIVLLNVLLAILMGAYSEVCFNFEPATIDLVSMSLLSGFETARWVSFCHSGI
jgi:polycystin 2L1